MDRVVVNQLTVDRLTGRQVDRFICYQNVWYLAVIVQRLTGEQSCCQPVDG